jgi:hypothetical protein
MRRRYLGLMLAVVLMSLAIVALARRPHREPAAAAAPAAPAETELVVVLEGGGVSPATCSIPKDHDIRLRVINHRPGAATLTLIGYQDRVTIQGLPSGGERQVEFVADRPGDDFVWILDGLDAGRLSVTGSHLVEGHR